MNDSRVDKVLLLLLLVVTTLEDAKGHESKTTILGLMQLFRYDDGTPTPLFFNLYDNKPHSQKFEAQNTINSNSRVGFVAMESP